MGWGPAAGRRCHFGDHFARAKPMGRPQDRGSGGPIPWPFHTSEAIRGKKRRDAASTMAAIPQGAKPMGRTQDPTQDWVSDVLKFGLMDEILTNSKARRDFHILQTYEAGIVLHGTEVKSLRAGRGQITDAFARVERNEVWLHNAHIDEYSHGNLSNHLPKTARKLLLNRSEIRKLLELAKVKGNTLVPLSFYWKSGKIKVQLAVGKGKDSFDKRDDVRERESDREIKRAMMHRHKGR